MKGTRRSKLSYNAFLKANESTVAEVEEYFGMAIEDQNALWKKKFIQAAEKIVSDKKLITKVTYRLMHKKRVSFLLKRHGSFKRVSSCSGVWGFVPHLPSQHS